MKTVALLFSGYNQRSVIALCRYFSSFGQKFAIVASGSGDTIHRTTYKKNVIFTRDSQNISLDLFKSIASICGSRLVYCPTSEFLNIFILENVKILKAIGITSGMPNKSIYSRLTSKKSSQRILNDLEGVRIPDEICFSNASIPCIIKPKENIVDGKVAYPIICETETQFVKAARKLNKNNYFVQEYVSGQSYYVCGYVDKCGNYSCYWQENLLQQPEGKSIVLARMCVNPGLDESRLFGAVASIGYYGPVMVEFIKSQDQFYYIETNPRFWGPLQLGVDCGSDFLSLYSREWFNGGQPAAASKHEKRRTYYSWYAGAQLPNLKIYPAAESLEDLNLKVEKFDVYNRSDTVDLHKKA